MSRKLSGTNLALVFFTLTLVLSTVGMIEIQSIYHSSYVIYVSKLSEKPNNYFVLENPDRYVLEAMSTQNYVHIGSPQETQLDELLSAHRGSSLEYNGTYYSAGYFFDTNSVAAVLIVEALLGIALSAMGLGVGVIIAYPSQCKRFW
ncbi:MAG: hypothetical protein ABSA75_13615 [Candidatus Bathyarchaeia archaeon]|jgi:hypothetical protein